MALKLDGVLLVELSKKSTDYKDVTVTAFSKSGKNISIGENFYEIVPKLLSEGFYLASESHTSYHEHVLYFQRQEKTNSDYGIGRFS